MSRDAEESGQHGFRLLRHVHPPDVPWPGALAATTEQTTVYLVPAAELAATWTLQAEAHDHLLTPDDVALSPIDLDVVLPVCTETAIAFLQRRQERELPLTAGETVTLLLSVLRGLLASRELPSEEWISGTWWLTDAGRPVIAGAGTDPIDVASRHLLEHLRDVSPPALTPRIAALSDALTDPGRLRHCAPGLESELFAAADPAPLATTSLQATRARASESAAGQRSWATRAADEDEHTIGQGWRERVADRLSDWVTTVVARSRRPVTGSRKRAWVVAGAGAALLVAVGMLWPRSAPPVSAIDTPSPSHTARETTSVPAPVTTRSDDPVAAAATLLDALSRCDTEPSTECEQTPPTAREALHHAAHAQGGAGVSLELVDSYGAAALVRAVMPEHDEQLLLIVRSGNGSWALREVYDLPDTGGS